MSRLLRRQYREAFVVTQVSATHEALHALKIAAAHPDKEERHRLADQALLNFLHLTGNKEVAVAFEAIPKWYA